MIKGMMFKKISAIFVILSFAMGAMAQKYDGVIDKTVAVVGNSVILLSEVEAEAQMMQFNGYISNRNLRCEVLENMMISKLFYTQAVLDSLTVNPDNVNAALADRMANILSKLGGEAAVEEYFGKSISKLEQQWRNIFLEQSLVQDMQRQVANAIPEMTPRQVKEFYENSPKENLPIIPVQYKYSQIVMYPDVRKAEMEAREKLLDFRQRILDGERFNLLATLYSDCPSAMRGGELGMASKSLYWPAFSDAAMALKEGQVSPIVETPDGYHLIQLIKREGDMFNARHILLKPKYSEEDRDSVFAELAQLKLQLQADTITFEQAARLHSQDAQSKTNGGVVADVNTGAPLFEIDQLKPADYAMLKNLEPGEISEPFESTDNEGRSGNVVYKIVRLEEVVPSHPASYESDFNVLLDIAKNQQMMEAIEKFISEKQKVTYIVIDPLFGNCDFEREGWVK